MFFGEFEFRFVLKDISLLFEVIVVFLWLCDIRVIRMFLRFRSLVFNLFFYVKKFSFLEDLGEMNEYGRIDLL